MKKTNIYSQIELQESQNKKLQRESVSEINKTLEMQYQLKMKKNSFKVFFWNFSRIL